MEVRNIRGTFDSSKVRSEGLEDEGTAKEPLPFLKGVFKFDIII
jgi:hypothetical protein